MGSSQPRPRRVVNQGGLALFIVAAHVALVWIVLQSTLARTTAAPVSLTVSLLPPSKSTSPVVLAQPSVVMPHLATIAPSDLEIPSDTPVFASTAPTPSPPVLAPAPSTTAEPTPSTEPITLSQIAYLKEPSPHYPPAARHAREEGLVVLRVVIDENGRVRNIAVYRSSGHPRLDEAAREAVSVALFKPYVSAGVARVAIAMIPIEFSLHGASS